MARDTPYLPLSNGSGSSSQALRGSILFKRFCPRVGVAFATAGLIYMLLYTLTWSPIKKSIPYLITAPVDETHYSYKPTPRPLETSSYLTTEQVRSVVSNTKGYFSKDWSLYLGWNNMRYIIEAGVVQAELLNRTLVIPSFVYARGCEFDITACATLAPTVNRGDALGIDTWRGQPIQNQMGWKIDIRLMFNITRMREKHNIILMAEYLQLHGLPLSTESQNGTWYQSAYHKGANIFTKKKPSLFVVDNYWYDWHANHQISRLDRIPEEWKTRGKWDPTLGDHSIGQSGGWPESVDTEERRALDAKLPDNAEAITISSDWAGLIDNDPGAAGYEAAHTFEGACGIEMVKHVVFPIRQAIPRRRIRGWVDDFDMKTEDVLILTEETHADRKPGTIRFSTAKARDEFAQFVLRDMHPIEKVYELARVLDQRMLAKNNGRMWMGAHMRRGDFAVLGWTMEKGWESHFKRIKERLTTARHLLSTITPEMAKSYDIPGVKVDRTFWQRPPPNSTDKFYLATDERDPVIRQRMSDQGAVYIQDLLTYEDRREFGPFIMLTDVMALIEQTLLARSGYFYGHCMSSLAGGILNLRAARGDDYRTAVTD